MNMEDSMTTNNDRNKDNTNNRNQKNDNISSNDLSKATAVMRSDDSSSEVKSRAASVMGHEGGKHSYNNDTNRNNRDK
jgi:hypothetical protein